MARSSKPAGGRVTPKGTSKGAPKGVTKGAPKGAPPSSGRYTPPAPRADKPSPLWVPIVMFTALGLGMLTILANYVDLLPGDGPSNTYLLVGLGLITAGFVMATRYR